MKILITGLYLFMLMQFCFVQENQSGFPDKIQVVLDNTKELQYERGDRLPLFLWPAMDPGPLTVKEAEKLVDTLNSRGIALVASWKTKNREDALSQALTINRAQKKLGLKIHINAIDLLYSFFNGDERTAHIDSAGNLFWDESFGGKKNMGCPFAINFRKEAIRERVEYYLDAYESQDLTVDFIFADWEVDGPLEVNRAYESSQKCIRCREYLGESFTFSSFQKKMREMRSYLQFHVFSQPVLSRFPDALVGNYAVYPHDGYRYWYDYFEYFVEGQPHLADQKARYRKWYEEFPGTGYTFAMPVSYTWSRIFDWYDYDQTDYRWVYNMLLVASNAGKSTPQDIPIISFVHWHIIFHPRKPDPTVIQMSRESYQELLWHMLLRGTDAFFMWSGADDYPEEVRYLHEVYAEAQKYGDFLESGIPINYEVPDQPGTVISGLALDNRVLIRRTDFGDNRAPVNILAGTEMITVSFNPGQCQMIPLTGK
jgi:hypothetical protein